MEKILEYYVYKLIDPRNNKTKNNAKYFLGKSLSDNHKKKISNSMKGLKRSEETKKKYRNL